MGILSVLEAGKHNRQVPVKIWTDLAGVESEALEQLSNVAAMPFVFKHVAVMPDVHVGKGATVGTVLATRNALIPAAVGVDIGCGMYAMQTDLSAEDLDGKLPALRSAIEGAVPVGFHAHKELSREARDWAGWLHFPVLPQQVQDRYGKAQSQLGTLGGGNHFIEICLDAQSKVWIMLHSGSRNIGKELADVHIHEAKGLMRQMMIGLPDEDLAYLPEGTAQFAAYWNSLEWAQEYALENRRLMAQAVFFTLQSVIGQTITPSLEVNCHHNYAAREHHFGENVFVTRKGAVRAREGDYGIIPGSMGTRSYIVKGNGNPDSFCSCSHGAGRRMSRSQARKQFTLADLAAQTDGVECRKDSGVIDEIPASYKAIEEVMANQADLVEIVAELKQVLCVKG